MKFSEIVLQENMDWRGRISTTKLYFQDGGHDVLSPLAAVCRSLLHMQQRPPAAR